jgi:predicted dehydrogenase
MLSAAVAIVGTGDWARNGLAPALTELPGAALVACVSPDHEQAAQFAADFAVPHRFSSFEALLTDGLPIDLVVIATPDDHHPAAVRGAIAAGLAVYCEKPVANTARVADDLAHEVASGSRPASVGFSFRYSDAVQRLRHDFVTGALGTAWLLELYEHNSQFHPRVGRPMTWKHDPAHAGGGALFEYGAHILDLGAWLLGPTHDVAANFARVHPGARLDDIATVQLRYADDVLGTAVASWVLAGGFPGIRVVLHGSTGTAEALLDDARTTGDVYRRLAPDGTVLEEMNFPALEHHGYARRHLADLLATLRGDTPRYAQTLPTFADGAHVQHVLEAALAATEHRVPVSGPGR